MGCTCSGEGQSARAAGEFDPSESSKVALRPLMPEEAPITPPDDADLLGNCLICLPEASVRLLGLVPNMDDKGDRVKTLWFGRLWQLRVLALRRYRRDVLSKQRQLTSKEKAEIDKALQDPAKRAICEKMQKLWKGAVARRRGSLHTLEPLAFSASSHAGTVLFMHGSGGMTYNNVRYARKLAGMGFLVIAPDSMAGGDYRHRELAGLISSTQDTPYWDDLGLYTSATQGDLAYNTEASAVVQNPQKFRELYSNVFRLRSAEMNWILSHLPLHMCIRGVFTMGQSEGAMTVARFDDRKYGAMIRGRIISAFSVEYCYFTPTREAGTYGGSEEVATLNIIGDADQFFGPKDSVAASVCSQKDGGGWGSDNLTGNGFKEMKRKKLRRGLVAVLDGARHDPSETHDNFLRDLLRAFLATPSDCHRIVDQWKCDEYLSSKVKVDALDTEGSGIRMLIKVSKMDLPSTLPYKEEMLKRMIGLTDMTGQNMHKQKSILNYWAQQEKSLQEKAQERAKKEVTGATVIAPKFVEVLGTAYDQVSDWKMMPRKSKFVAPVNKV